MRIEVWKGFEYRPVTASTRSRGRRQSASVNLTIAHARPMASEGWYSGDPHLHFIAQQRRRRRNDLRSARSRGHPLRAWSCATTRTRAAIRGLMPELATPQLRGLGIKSIAAAAIIRSSPGQEYRNGVFGHLNLYLRDRLVLEGRAARSEPRPAVRHDRRGNAGAGRLRLSRPRRLRAGDLGRPGAAGHQRRGAVAVRHLSRHRAGRLVSRARLPASAFRASARATIRPAASWATAAPTSTSTASRLSKTGCKAPPRGAAS